MCIDEHTPSNRMIPAELLETLNDGIWDWDLTTDDCYFSPRWKQMLGYEDHELPNVLETWNRVIHPDEKPKIESLLEAHFNRGEPFVHTSRVFHKDGSIHWILARGSCIRGADGRVKRLVGCHTDLTELKRTEEALLAKTRALEATGIGFWSLDVATGQAEWDDQMYRLYGVKRGTFSPSIEAWQTLLHPDDREIPTFAFRKVKAGAEPESLLLRALPVDGEMRWIRAVAQAIRDENGELVRLVGINWDVTKKMRAQEMLRDQEIRLLHSSKMAALGEMAGGIAHEINNPLAVINMHANRMKDRLERGIIDEDGFMRSVEVIERTCERIARIVSGLRLVARDGGGDPLYPMSVEKLVEDAIGLCAEKAKYLGTELIIEPIPENLRVECRRVQIAQVLLNLLNNAFRATKDCKERWIRVHVATPDDWIEIRVSDSGKGIPLPLRSRIFEPFFTTKPPGEGTGLGLSISSSLVKGHGGEIFVDSTAPETCFVVRLPRTSRNQAVTTEPAAEVMVWS